MTQKIKGMNKKENINQQVNEALDSFEGAQRATTSAYLLTRIRARMANEQNSVWEQAGRFIARPWVFATGLFLIIGMNVLLIVNNNNNTPATSVAEQISTPDELSNTVATLYDIENNEP
jgi:formate/nitrite transporter FocA (FNT family)